MRRSGTHWEQEGALLGMTFSKACKALQTLKTQTPNEVYELQYLAEVSDRIVWLPATEIENYGETNKKELLKIFYRLGLDMNDHGYSVLSRITGISVNTLTKLTRNAKSSGFSPLSNEGLVFIKYQVQQHIDSKGES